MQDALATNSKCSVLCAGFPGYPRFVPLDDAKMLVICCGHTRATPNRLAIEHAVEK